MSRSNEHTNHMEGESKTARIWHLLSLFAYKYNRFISSFFRYGVVKKALEAYGYEPGEKIAFKDNVVTHNDLTFSMYTKEVNKL